MLRLVSLRESAIRSRYQMLFISKGDAICRTVFVTAPADRRVFHMHSKIMMNLYSKTYLLFSKPVSYLLSF